ncbi:Unknown protein sequence [Pseudomonas amygdali pv. lachrymans]|uniref:Uncharacterized protein n=1 Tax=Pseudomonas amygdali pv. lachrymans TaxID=53707 RepID=A0ABR5KS52_PSEAV|nr:Unknown protein sequence [Pseudomonas amygdali pv. lachrymans]
MTASITLAGLGHLLMAMEEMSGWRFAPAEIQKMENARQ